MTPLLDVVATLGLAAWLLAVRRAGWSSMCRELPRNAGVVSLMCFVLITTWGAPIEVRVGEDVWLAAGMWLISIARAASVPEVAGRDAVLDVLTLAAALTNIGCILALPGLTGLATGEALVVLAIVSGSAAYVAVLYRLGTGFDQGWRMSATTLAGLLLLYVGNVGYVALSGSGRSMLVVWPVWVAGILMAAAGAPRGRGEVPRSSVTRPELVALSSVLIAMGAGALGAVVVPMYPQMALIAVPTIAFATCLAVSRVVQARRDRAVAAAALDREVLLRGMERRDMARLLHDHVLQLLVAATWLSPDAAAAERVANAETRLRALLHELRGDAQASARCAPGPENLEESDAASA